MVATVIHNIIYHCVRVGSSVYACPLDADPVTFMNSVDFITLVVEQFELGRHHLKNALWCYHQSYFLTVSGSPSSHRRSKRLWFWKMD